jgi:cell fate (sporulation/competence/biofilm development) regulator YlbF (YheA/YmcA/DUF963 family)
MQDTATDNPVHEKIRSLCQALTEQSDFRRIQKQIDAFRADPAIQRQYQELDEKGSALEQKQRQGHALAESEVGEFESARDAFLAQPVALGFLQARRDMHDLQQTVAQYLTKTFELGRVPEPEDLASGCCGGGSCGSHDEGGAAAEKGECCGGQGHDHGHSHGQGGCGCH